MDMTMEKYATNFVEGSPDECWPWKTTSRDKNGYGIISWRTNGKHTTRRAHRWGWEARFGPIPPGQVVRHKCDNPPCQNPSHWLLGTVRQNNQDTKDRGRERYANGQSHYKAALTSAQVAEIRSRFTGEWGQYSNLAREYGVSRKCISGIVKNLRRVHS